MDFEDFDTRMKGRAEAEDCPIPQDFEKRLEMRLEELPAQARSKKRLGRRIIAIMAAVLILTGSALAISPTLREQLSRALGLFEPYTTPIESASAVDQGIKVQILSAMADDYTVHIYLEIQDLTGERPMKHILDLLTDSFVPNVDNEIQIRWGGTKLLGYNEKTHTALVDVYTAGEDYRSLRDWNLRIGGISFYSENKVETIYGTWELPFTLTALETRTISLDAGDHSDFHTLKISPIGLVLEGGPDSFPQATEAELIFADGHTESVEQGSGAGVMGQTISSWYFSEPISPDEIVRVELPCWTITLNSEDQGSVTRK
ncbi:DUF4179 domain-containing protein [Pseudoflavonifractor phocaeensis]|uniref:DUF4179 domain-containing protein n=1 Tax=Pseudoflavonifractor phocaeensis TaxID=1870988 RepID=UPI0025A429F1|nr:DUF4179 domain-containing protein [Pseudoflavonifractor phocaeensis]MDM8238899.1 DUF4179 domain-containing protein [Pseudoflavonifractor phocaeensis]